jgi:hypothetical protein
MSSLFDQFTFEVLNRDDNIVPIDIEDWTLDRYFDRPGTLNILVNDQNAVSRDATAEVKYKNKIIFRGYLDLPERNLYGQNTLKFKDRVSLLDYRFAQDYSYLKGSLISDIMSHAEPGAVGLLYQANSLIPQGSFTKYQMDKYKKRYSPGTFGTLTEIKEDGTALTHAGSVAEMVAGSWFQDANYVYLWATDSLNPFRHLLIYTTTTGKTGNLRGMYYRAGAVTNTYKLDGAGTSSQLGVISKIYAGTTLLTLGSGGASLTNNQYFQDATDLYVKVNVVPPPYSPIDPNTVHMTVPNFKDTFIRVGSTMNLAEYTFDEDFEVTRKTISSTLKDLMTHINGECAFIHDLDGYTYLDTDEEISRGSVTEPVRIWDERNVRDLNISFSPEYMSNYLLSTGDPDSWAAYGSWLPRKIWREIEESKINHDIESMMASLETQFALKQSAISTSFKADPDSSLDIGDWCRINRKKNTPITARIKHIQLSLNADMSIEMGQRERNLADIFTLVKQIVEEQRQRKMKNSYGQKWLKNP